MRFPDGRSLRILGRPHGVVWRRRPSGRRTPLYYQVIMWVVLSGFDKKFRKMKIDSEREKHDRMKAEQLERARREEERRKQIEQEEKIAEMKAQAEKQAHHTPAKNHTQTITGSIYHFLDSYPL